MPHRTGQDTGDTVVSNQFTAEEVRVLKKIVKERLKKGSIPTKILFDRNTTTMKTVRLPAQLVSDATKREKNFNRLIEYLLWDYLGQDRKYLAKQDSHDDDEQ